MAKVAVMEGERVAIKESNGSLVRYLYEPEGLIDGDIDGDNAVAVSKSGRIISYGSSGVAGIFSASNYGTKGKKVKVKGDEIHATCEDGKTYVLDLKCHHKRTI